MPVIATLSAVVTADTVNFERGMRSVSLGLSLAGAEMVAFAGSVAALFKSGADLQQVFQRVQANTDMTVAAMKDMEAAVISLGAHSAASFEDLALGFMHVTNFGFQAADVTKILDVAMQSAVATGTKVEQTANVLAGVLHEFGLSGDEASAAMNTLHHAAALGNLTLEQFVAIAGRVFSTAANLSVPLEQASAALAALTRAGFTSQQAATQLVNIMQRIVAPTKDAQVEIARLAQTTGVDLVSDFSLAGIQAKGLSGVLVDLKLAAGNNSDEMLKLFGRIRGGLGAMALIGNASADYNKILNELSDTMSGKLTPVQDNYKLATETLAFQVDTLKNKFQLLGFELFTALGPQLTASLETLNGVVLKTIGFIANLPPQIVAATVAFTAAVGVVGTVITAFGGLVALLGLPMLTAIAGVVSAIGLMAAAFATNFGGILSATATWFGGMQTSFRGVAGMIGALLDVWLTFVRIFVQGVDTVITAARILVGAMVTTIKTANAALEGIVAFVNKDVVGMAAALSDLGGVMKGGMDDAWNQIKGFGARFAENAKATAANVQGYWRHAFEGAVDSAGEFAKGVQEKASQLVAKFKEFASQVPPAMSPAQKAVKDLTEALTEQMKVLEELKKAMGEIVEGINTVFRNMEVGEILHNRIIPVLDEMMRKLAEASGFADAFAAHMESAGAMAGTAMGQLASQTGALNPLFREMGEAVLFGDGSFEKLIATLIKSKEAQAEAAKAAWDSKVAFGALMGQFNEMKNRIPPTWATIVDAIVNGSGKAGAAALELGVKIAGALGDVAQVVGNLPGKIGDSLRKATSEFEKWFNTIDGILKLLNRVFNSVPASLGDALSKVIGIFKKSSTQIEDTMTHTEDEVMNSTAGIAKSAETNIGSSVPKAFGIGAAAAAGFATSLEVAANASSKAMGFLESTITSALAGIAAGFAFGPVAGAIVGGVSLIGGIIGLFRGKSAQQKAQEQAQLDKLKADIAAEAQQTVNAALEGMKSALELFDKLADFTVIPQKTIHRFFNHLELVLQEFVELSKVFNGGMLDAAKAFAEKMGPIVDTIGNAVGAFEALGSFTGVAQVSVDSFVSAMTRVLQSFISIKDKFLDAEGFIDTTVNQAKKFANKIGDIIVVIKDALDAFAGFQTFKNVLPETLDAFAATLQLAINKMGEIAEAVDKSMIKTAQRFSDRALSVVALIKGALDAFGPLATFAAIPAEAMDALFAGISDAVNRMQQLAAALDTEMLTRAVAVAEKSSAIFGAIKAGVDTLTSLIDFKGAAPEAFQALLDGFNQAVSILNAMLEKATQFESIAIQIESKLTSAAQHLKDGATAMAAGLASATAATGGTSGGGSTSIASLGAGPSVTGFGIGAPASPFASSGGSTVVETYHVSVTVQGSMLGTRAELQDVVVGAITQAQRRGRAAA